MASVLCVGIAVLDNMFAVERFPTEPTKVFAREFHQIGGGPASNAAATIAKLGGKATYWGRVGDDAIGARLIEELSEYEVDVGTVRRVPDRRTGVSAVVVDERGERMIFAFADRELDTDPSWLPDEIPDGVDVVLCDVRWPAASEKVMRKARARGLQVVLDADLTTDDAIARLIGYSTHAVFSSPALERLTGTRNIEAGLRAAQERTEGAVSVTLGAKGFAWIEGSDIRKIDSYSVPVVDTLAAGDVFHGAFALGIAEGMTIERAGRFAAAAAGLKCTRWGGRAGIPTRSELDDFMTAAA
ncbi:PfkB family carbohydrate kinase [Bauldia litoralis]|uniref:Sulfofructose kinase n=1 Tax=Bauldia litoralis TaxID=665467 RepID=A0A1G6EQ41_9HYPH|nr:PfkB family carbohydrate kinase [Bauldia litoralis]SDB59015.1 sulfofructose kinase [Bauldia litoralis]